MNEEDCEAKMSNENWTAVSELRQNLEGECERQWWLAEVDRHGVARLHDGPHLGHEGCEKAAAILRELGLAGSKAFAIAEVVVHSLTGVHPEINREAIAEINRSVSERGDLVAALERERTDAWQRVAELEQRIEDIESQPAEGLIARLEQERDEWIGCHARLHRSAGDLLAIIHRDGGHYIQRHGIDKAFADAEQRIYDERGALDAMTAERDELRAKLAACERQRPVAWQDPRCPYDLYAFKPDTLDVRPLYAHPLALREPTEDECREIGKRWFALMINAADESAGRAMFNAVRDVMTK